MRRLTFAADDLGVPKGCDYRNSTDDIVEEGGEEEGRGSIS